MELVVVEMICRMGAGEASAEEVGVVGVDRGLGWAGTVELDPVAGLDSLGSIVVLTVRCGVVMLDVLLA